MAEEQKIMVKAIVEVLGSPKEHVEDTMKSVAEKIKDVFGVVSYNVYEAQEVQGLWSTFS